MADVSRTLLAALPTGCWRARLQVFGSSPDETAYCRLYLNRETTADALVMMQPSLLTYSMEVGLAPRTHLRYTQQVPNDRWLRGGNSADLQCFVRLAV